MSKALIIVIAIIVIIALWLMSSYNKLVGLRNSAKEGFSTMDVYLKKRFDMIPNLVETVKGYASHESKTLESVIQARNSIANATNISDQLEGENMLTNTLKSLFALSEAYPDLKANQNFIDLQEKIQGVEEDIANSRKYYNGTVLALNNAIEMFPSNIVAKMFRFEQMSMFEVSNKEERENVKVQF
ncbi:LemA family protein [Peptostreptococcus russellii]|uniref:LemA family protein n=1 Tax=Peptostreptococcus russellii TaxID=215200 RepID=UPI003F58387B